MMWRKRTMLLSAVLAVAVIGCGQSRETDRKPAGAEGVQARARTGQNAAVPSAGVPRDGPAAAVFEFLEAVRIGNEQRTTAMLSTVAREKTPEFQGLVNLPASDTARFEVGEVEQVSADVARVACTWADLDERGQAETDEAIWVVRLEPSGWRIAGVAITVFEGEPPLLLNFEDPADRRRKLQWVRQEMLQRAENQKTQARGRENSGKSIRR